jgi:hypothetical protein
MPIKMTATEVEATIPGLLDSVGAVSRPVSFPGDPADRIIPAPVTRTRRTP